MFDPKALKKKKHSDDEMAPKEAYEVSEEKEQYRKQKGMGEMLSAKTHVSSPILTAKLPSKEYKGMGSIDSVKYKPSPIASIDSIKYKPSLLGSVKTKYEPSLTGSIATKYKPMDLNIATKYEPSDLGIATKGMKEEAPKKAKTKTESRIKMEALIAAAAKKDVSGKKKGDIIFLKGDKPASEKDKILIEKELKKTKKAK